MARGFPTVPGVVLLALAGLVVSALAFSPPLYMERSVVAGGGWPSAGNSHRGTGTVGQAGTGRAQGSQYRVHLGYRVGGALTPTAVDDGVPALPRRYELSQNHPNPFNPVTTIGFALPQAGRAVMVLHDARGRRVRTLVDAQLSAGQHQVVLNASELSSGIYWYTLQSRSFSKTRKLVLVK